MAGDVGDDNETERYEVKEQLVKADRMYAMCQKAGVAEPMDVTGLAVAAWSFSNSKSPQEFEQRLKEIKTLPKRGEPS